MIARALKRRLHQRRRPLRYRYLVELLRNEALSAEELARLRQRRLDRLVRFAIDHCDFYRDRFAELDLPRSDIPVERLPVLDKDDVRAHRDALRNRDLPADATRIGQTGGSTGRPLSFHYDDDKIEYMRAGMMRGYRWCGWEPGEKILNFWGARQDVKHGAGRRYRDFIAAEQTIGAWEYSDRELAEWAARIRAWRPVVLQGYASILAEVARHVLRRGLRMPPLKGVYSTAEALHDRQREAIESAFGCRVFNQYGSREVPNIALECRHGNLHVFSDNVWLEAPPGEEGGRLLVTSLHDRVMPFIRYANGDSGRLKEGGCACGSPFPLMEMGLCRDNDIVRLADGRRVYPSWFVHLLDGLSGIRRFQFEQTAVDQIRLRLLGTLPSAADSAILQRRVADELGMRLDIVAVDDIPSGASGKHRFVIAL